MFVEKAPVFFLLKKEFYHYHVKAISVIVILWTIIFMENNFCSSLCRSYTFTVYAFHCIVCRAET